MLPTTPLLCWSANHRQLKQQMCSINFFLKIIPRTVLKFQFIIIVNIKAISMKRKYTPSGPEKGLHQEPYSLQNNGTMQIWCTAPSGATQFYRGVLFWIYNRIQIMYDSQFKKWHAQCFLRLHIKYQNGPIFYEAWGHLPNLLFVLSRHCSFNIRIKNPCHRKRSQKIIKINFLLPVLLVFLHMTSLHVLWQFQPPRRFPR